MAVVVPTHTLQLDSLVTVTWAGVTSSDTVDPHFVVCRPKLAAVQVEGLFDPSTVVSILGSVSGNRYETAHTTTQSVASFTTPAAAGILEPFAYWKPAVAGGSSDSVTISLSYWMR